MTTRRRTSTGLLPRIGTRQWIGGEERSIGAVGMCNQKSKIDLRAIRSRCRIMSSLQLGDGDPQTAGMVLAGMSAFRPYTVEDDPRVIDPDVVKHIGHGSLAAGQKVLQRFVQMVRRQSREVFVLATPAPTSKA